MLPVTNTTCLTKVPGSSTAKAAVRSSTASTARFMSALDARFHFSSSRTNARASSVLSTMCTRRLFTPRVSIFAYLSRSLFMRRLSALLLGAAAASRDDDFWTMDPVSAPGSRSASPSPRFAPVRRSLRLRVATTGLRLPSPGPSILPPVRSRHMDSACRSLFSTTDHDWPRLARYFGMALSVGVSSVHGGRVPTSRMSSGAIPASRHTWTASRTTRFSSLLSSPYSGASRAPDSSITPGMSACHAIRAYLRTPALASSFSWCARLPATVSSRASWRERSSAASSSLRLPMCRVIWSWLWRASARACSSGDSGLSGAGMGPRPFWLSASECFAAAMCSGAARSRDAMCSSAAASARFHAAARCAAVAFGSASRPLARTPRS